MFPQNLTNTTSFLLDSSNSNNNGMISNIIDSVLIILLLCLIFLCCCLFFLLFRKKKHNHNTSNEIKSKDQISVPVMESNMLFNESKDIHNSNIHKTLRDDPSDPLIDTDSDEQFDKIHDLPIISNYKKHNKQISAQSTLNMDITPTQTHNKQISAQSTINTILTPGPIYKKHNKQISAQSTLNMDISTPNFNKQISAQSTLNINITPKHNKEISAQSFDGMYKRDTITSVKTIYKLEGKNDENTNENTVEMNAINMLRYGEKSNLTIISKQNTVYSDCSINNNNSNLTNTNTIDKYKQANEYINNVQNQYKQKHKAYPSNVTKGYKNNNTNGNEDKKAYPMHTTKYKNLNETNININGNVATKYKINNNKDTNNKKVMTNIQRNRPFSMPNEPVYGTNGNDNNKAYPRNRTKSMKTGTV